MCARVRPGAAGSTGRPQKDLSTAEGLHACPSKALPHQRPRAKIASEAGPAYRSWLPPHTAMTSSLRSDPCLVRASQRGKSVKISVPLTRSLIEKYAGKMRGFRGCGNCIQDEIETPRAGCIKARLFRLEAGPQSADNQFAGSGSFLAAHDKPTALEARERTGEGKGSKRKGREDFSLP